MWVGNTSLGSHEFGWFRCWSLSFDISFHLFCLFCFVCSDISPHLFCLSQHQNPQSTEFRCRTGDRQQGVDAANGGSAEGASLAAKLQWCIPRTTRARRFRDGGVVRATVTERPQHEGVHQIGHGGRMYGRFTGFQLVSTP